MENPFDSITNRLKKIEDLILDLKKVSNKKTDSIDKLLTVEEAAKFLCLTVQTIYSKVHKGEIPFMKRSKRLYFSSKELVDYLKQGRVKSVLELDREAEQYLSNKKGKDYGNK